MEASIKQKFYTGKPDPDLTTEQREVFLKQANKRREIARQNSNKSQFCQKCGTAVVFLESEFNYPRFCLKCASEKSQAVIPTPEPETKPTNLITIGRIILFWIIVIIVISSLIMFILRVIDQ